MSGCVGRCGGGREKEERASSVSDSKPLRLEQLTALSLCSSDSGRGEGGGGGGGGGGEGGGGGVGGGGGGGGGGGRKGGK